MGLLESILGALAGKSEQGGASGQDLLGSALNHLVQANGGLPGLMQKFQHGGLGEVFSSWVGLGENQAVSPQQIQSVFGADQLQGIASSLGVNAEQASDFLAQYLPKIVDKLTPAGRVDHGADVQQGLAAVIPLLVQALGGDGSARA
jgi:uncharacterized protein YidB (DUF937 family)